MKKELDNKEFETMETLSQLIEQLQVLYPYPANMSMVSFEINMKDRAGFPYSYKSQKFNKLNNK